jgi:aconitate hydratase
MGVLPLQLPAGVDTGTLGLTGRERFTIEGVAAGIRPRQQLTVTAVSDDGKRTTFPVDCRVDTPEEAEYYRHGGILPYVLRQLVKKG